MSTVEKLTIALTPEMAEFVREAVREWHERRELLGYTVEELRTLVQEGIDSGPSKRGSMDDIKAEARRRFERSANAQLAI